MSRDPRVLLADVARAGADIQRFTEGMERATYLYDNLAPEKVWDYALIDLPYLLRIVKVLLAELGPLEE